MNAKERLIRARSALILRQPFWGTLSLYLQIVEEPSIGTMATDGVHLFYDAKFVESITELELQGVIAHEVSHCAYRHMTRRQNRDPKLWNIAADYMVNLDLVDAGFVLPKGALIDPSVRGVGAEELYERLSQRVQNQPKPRPGQGNGQGKRQSKPGQQPGQGQSNDEPQECPWGQVLDAPKPGHGAQPEGTQAGQSQTLGQGAQSANGPAASGLDNEWQVRVRQAAAITKGRGTIPGAIERIISALNEPQVDWREQLRAWVDDRTIWDYTYSRPNKRVLHAGYILPGQQADGCGKLALVVDTSGSISDNILQAFSNEMQGMLDTGAVGEVVVVFCDARVQHTESFNAGEIIQLKVHGGGGTAFRPAFEWIAQNEPDVRAVVYFTDLECGDFGQEPGCPVLWAAYGQKSHVEQLMQKVPFGTSIHVNAV